MVDSTDYDIGIGIILIAVAYFGDKLWRKYVLRIEEEPKGSEKSVALVAQSEPKFNRGENISKKDLSEFGFEMVIDTNAVIFVTPFRYEKDPVPSFEFSANIGGQTQTFRARNIGSGWFSNGSIDPKLISLRTFLIDCIR